MSDRRRTPATKIVVFAAIVLIISISAPSATTARTRADAAVFSATALEDLLNTMGPIERLGREAAFRNPRYEIVAYSRAFVPLSDDGLPLAPAASGVEPLGSGSRNGLYVSVSVARDFDAPDYRWDITSYFDWSSGGDCCNASEDSFGLAWGGSLGMVSDHGWGLYDGGSYLDAYRSDATPNVGTGWSFHEWKQSGTPYRANYGWLTSTIKETRFQNYYTSVVAKYFHTYSGLTYSLSFSAAPGMSISPTSSQWSLAEYAGFTV